MARVDSGLGQKNSELYFHFFSSFKITLLALAGVAQWIEYWPSDQRVTGLIPCQGICLGCWPGSQWGVGGAGETTTH